MKKKYILLLLSAFVSVNASSQTFNWAFQAGDNVSQVGNCIVTDYDNAVLTGGAFGGTIDLDPHISNVANYTAMGTYDAFVLKCDSNHNYLWSIVFGSNGIDEIKAIAVDEMNNVYVTGSNGDDSVDFDPGPGIAYVSHANQSTNAFIAKYNSNGIFQWAFSIDAGWGSYSMGLGISIDPDNNVLATGFFQGADIDFDPGADTVALTSASFTPDIYVAKYNLSGDYIWAFKAGSNYFGSLFSDDNGNDIASDSSKNVYVTGTIGGFNIDFDPDTGFYYLSTSAGSGGGSMAGFLAKYDSISILQWAFAIQYSRIQSMTTDINGNIYIVGSMLNDSVDVDPDSTTYWLTRDITSSLHNKNTFIAKYTSAGKIIWAFNFGNDDGWPRFLCVALDPYSNIYITGVFGATSDFDPGPNVHTVNANGNVDIFLASYDSSGNYLWAFGIGAAGHDRGFGVAVDLNNHVYITGQFNTWPDFDPGTGVYQMFSNYMDLYVAKYTILLQTEAGTLNAFDQYGIMPNPCTKEFSLKFADGFSPPKQISFSIQDLTGKVIMLREAYSNNGFITIKTDNLPDGMYLLEIMNGVNSVIKKFIVSR